MWQECGEGKGTSDFSCMRHGSKEAEVSAVTAVLVLGPDVDSGKHPVSLASYPARRSLPSPPAPAPFFRKASQASISVEFRVPQQLLNWDM